MLVKTLLSALLTLACSSAFAVLTPNTTVTPDTYWGTGNTNQGFHVFTNGTGLELGLRAKQRYPSASDTVSGINLTGTTINPLDTYTHQAGLAGPGSNRAFWNFDYSINTNDGSPGGGTFAAEGLTFVMGIGFQAGGVGPITPIAVFNPLTWGDTQFATEDGMGGFTEDGPSPTVVGTANVAQNSLNLGFAGAGFSGLQGLTNNFGSGLYFISMGAYNTSDLGADIDPNDFGLDDLPDFFALNGLGLLQGEVSIVVNAVPEPTAALFGTLLASGLGMTIARRRREEEIA
jgi:hypothetical protein